METTHFSDSELVAAWNTANASYENATKKLQKSSADSIARRAFSEATVLAFSEMVALGREAATRRLQITRLPSV